MKLKHLVWLWAAILCSCSSTNRSNVKNTIPAVGTSIELADAHIKSADRHVQAAIKTPKNSPVLLPAAHAELDDASAATAVARKDIVKITAERNTLEVINGKLSDTITVIKAGWGYRLQVAIERFWFWLKVTGVSLIVLHFGLGLAGLVVSGPIGAVCAKLGVAINPFAWFQSVRDNIFFRKELKKQKDKK
jgi:hypothetical protein